MNSDLKVPNIEYKTYINTDVERVFKTLTTAEGWDAWFTQGTTIDLRPGGEICFRWKDFGVDLQTTSDGGPILTVEENRKFEFQWSPSSNPTTVSFILEKLGKGTKVILVESGYKLTSENLEALVNCAAGWGEALTLLKFYLEHGITYGKVSVSNVK